jgi:hypothetical protein
MEATFLGDLVVDGRTILKWMLDDIGCDDVDWIHLAQDRAQWQAFVHTEIVP